MYQIRLILLIITAMGDLSGKRYNCEHIKKILKLHNKTYKQAHVYSMEGTYIIK